MTRSKITVSPQYFGLYRKFSTRDWSSPGSRECLLASKRYLSKSFPRTVKGKREYLQNRICKERIFCKFITHRVGGIHFAYYNAVLLDFSAYNSTAFVFCKTTTRNVGMSRAIVRTNHIHKANYLSLLRTCRRYCWHNAMSECDMNNLVFAYNIDYIEIDIELARMYGTNINIRKSLESVKMSSILIHSWQESLDFIT